MSGIGGNLGAAGAFARCNAMCKGRFGPFAPGERHGDECLRAI